MKELSEQDKIYLNDLKSHLSHLDQNINYSLQRIDILVLAVATSGIVLITNFLSGIEDPSAYAVLLSKSTITILALSIGFNFVSQYYGYECNLAHYKIYQDKIHCLTYQGRIKENKFSDKEKKANKLSKIVGFLNLLTVFCLCLGITISIITFWVV